MPIPSREEIAKMSEAEKVALLDALMDSLDPPDRPSSYITEAQKAELRRRHATIEADEVEAIAMDAFLERLGKRYS
jgi:putative addiction module component (TIGR02574 family)